MLKKIVFQLHWLLGISLGLVLSIMGITGAIYAFEGEITDWLNASPASAHTRSAEALPPGALIAALEARTGSKVTFLRVNGLDTNSPAQAFMAPRPGERRGARIFLDPATGDEVAEPRGQAFFQFVLDLHRRLTIGNTGRQITGASAIALLFFCISGLYLRWPKPARNWRAWLTLDWAKKGRGFNWDLHAVAGTWSLVFYLILALTGLYWSYPWYRQGLERLLADPPAQTGQVQGQAQGQGQQQQRQAMVRALGGNQNTAPPPAPPPDYDALWQGLLQAADGQAMNWTLRIPNNAAQPFTVFYVLADALHPRAFNRVLIDPQSGRIVNHERYADKSFKAQILASIYVLHTGEYWGMTGRILMLLASLAMPIFFVTGWLLYLDRRRKKRAVRAARGVGASGGAPGAAGMADGWLIGFASQSGFAEQLAWQTAGQLQAANVPVQVQALAKLDAQQLGKASKALFIISTFGNGQAPDSARGFERKLLASSLSLSQLSYAVLALGDRQYEQFCGFARRVHDWLCSQGANSLEAPLEVDGADNTALARWRERVSRLTGARAQADTDFSAALPAWQTWCLAQRQCLNPGSSGAPTYWLALVPSEACTWEAGDILQVLPQGSEHAQEHPREYSIASIAQDGALELIVRQEKRSDGSLGLVSGYLTQGIDTGGTLQAKVKRNRNFHVPADDRPILLIGNGVGLAGLRALLKARALAGHPRNWLLFGERNRAHDFYCREELQAWLASGHLQRLDLAFSRDQTEKIYVQDVLRAQTPRLREWVAQGAAIYVCGSLVGMADGVDAVLRDALGEDALEQLVQDDRYRRDVF